MACVQGHAHAGGDHPLGHFQHRTAELSNARQDLVHGLGQLRFRDNSIHKSQSVGILGGERLSGQQQFVSLFPPDQRGKHDGREGRKHSHPDLGLGKAGIVVAMIMSPKATSSEPAPMAGPFTTTIRGLEISPMA